MFEKNQKVIKVIVVNGRKTATLQTVDCVTKNEVTLVDSGLTFRASNGTEVDPAIPGCYAQIIPLDDGEEERMRSMLADPDAKEALEWFAQRALDGDPPLSGDMKAGVLRWLADRGWGVGATSELAAQKPTPLEVGREAANKILREAKKPAPAKKRKPKAKP